MQLVLANKRLIEIFAQKTRAKISEVWGVKDAVDVPLSMAAEPVAECQAG